MLKFNAKLVEVKEKVKVVENKLNVSITEKNLNRQNSVLTKQLEDIENLHVQTVLILLRICQEKWTKLEQGNARER